MTKATIKGLLAFINEQPKDRYVSHASWARCAVGDYARSIGETVYNPLNNGDDYGPLYTDSVVKTLWNQAGSCDGRLRWAYADTPEVEDGMSLMDILSEGNLPHTYGKLAEYISTFRLRVE
jgi:hypothetical protein